MHNIQYQESKLSNSLLKKLAEPFRIIAYQIMQGTYINSIWKEQNTVHKFNEFLKQHRSAIGQMYEVRLLEKDYEVYFFTYSEDITGEYDEVCINFYSKGLALLGSYTANNSM